MTNHDATPITVSALNVYPIKSCRGTALQQADLDARGIRHDRGMMLVDRSDQYMTQRTFPRMALVKPELDGDHLRLSAPDMPELEVPLARQGPELDAVVWGDSCRAVSQGPEVAEWFSAFLDTDCRLVRMADDHMRPGASGPYVRTGREQVGFADAFPLLLISEASLADLNARMDQPVEMRRFRPNIVVSGCAPFAEDTWDTIQIGEMRIHIVKACVRCSIPTVDPETGLKGKEPSRTLATFRRNADGGVIFGQNATHETPGVIRVGDVVEVRESKR
jgi:uncharacterized protein YcbX